MSREYLTATVVWLLPALAFYSSASTYAGDKPNIIFIMTDQQHSGMMSCTGNRWLKTPAMDRLAREGVIGRAGQEGRKT